VNVKKKTEYQPNMSDELNNVYQSLRKNKKSEWNRILPFNELFVDRWEKAKFAKFKTGSSIYDSSLIFGTVNVGKETWVGPFVILDGSGGKLSIGSFCSISSGVQIYTHSSVKWALTKGKSKYEKGNVTIGDGCYIGPNAIISMNSKIGKCSVIGAQSFVNSNIPANSIAIGNPAKVVGKIKTNGKNVKFEYYDKK